MDASEEGKKRCAEDSKEKEKQRGKMDAKEEWEEVEGKEGSGNNGHSLRKNQQGQITCK